MKAMTKEAITELKGDIKREKATLKELGANYKATEKQLKSDQKAFDKQSGLVTKLVNKLPK